MIRFLLAALLLLAPATLRAQASVQNAHTRAELLIESAAPAPGRSVTFGIALTPQPGWHTYWSNPGDTGLATQAEWTLPSGVTASPLRHPVPKTFLVQGLMNYVLGPDPVLLGEFRIPASLKPGDALPIRVKLDWLVCDDKLCVPESATLSITPRIGDGAADPAVAPRFRAARGALPSELGAPATFALSGGRLVLAAPLDPAMRVTSAYFFASTEDVVDYAKPQVAGFGDGTLRLEIPATDGAKPDRIEGLLKLEVAGAERPIGLTLSAAPGAVPAPLPALAGGNAAGEAPGLAMILLLAVLGGLVLNVMPCVFPILSLKALSLARSGETEASARREALAYTAGVVLVCLALGGAILGLRAAGATVGWAFQLQDPRVITLLLLLITAVSLNLAGLFEIDVAGRGAGGSLAGRGGAAGAFWTGALAAFVATPCTGPFMGVALGAALVLPPAQGLAVFGGLGLGLALPFLLLGFVPALRRRLPKPGAWMDRLRRILSIPMFATALGLAWVLGRQAGVEGMTLGLAAALALGLLLWWVGRAQATQRGLVVPAVLALAASVAAIALVPTQRPAAGAAPAETATLAAQPFTEAKLGELRAAGTPVFAYFTADWCITCKVNERGAMASAGVSNAFAKAGVVTLVGDWTDGDPAITRFLEAQGRSGVPLYLYYAPGAAEPQVLPQLLTVSGLTALAGTPAPPAGAPSPS